MIDLPQRLRRLNLRPDLQDLVACCVECLRDLAEGTFAQARFNFPHRFAAMVDATRRCETERALTIAEELEGLAKRDDLFLGRYPSPMPREYRLMREVLHELGELSDDRLYGDIGRDAIRHAGEQVTRAWDRYLDASSGFFRPPVDEPPADG